MKTVLPGFLAVAGFAITANAQRSTTPRFLRTLQVEPEAVDNLEFGVDLSLSLSMGDASFARDGSGDGGGGKSGKHSGSMSGPGKSGKDSRSMSGPGKSGKGYGSISGSGKSGKSSGWMSVPGKSGKGSGWMSVPGKSGKGSSQCTDLGIAAAEIIMINNGCRPGVTYDATNNPNVSKRYSDGSAPNYKMECKNKEAAYSVCEEQIPIVAGKWCPDETMSPDELLQLQGKCENQVDKMIE